VLSLETREAEPSSDVGLERILFFSDAVIAIAITLLVLDIRLPEGEFTSSSALSAALLALQPKYFAYVISFLVVASFWTAHNQKFRLIRRYDTPLIWLNMLFLMTIGFVPFASSVLSAHANPAGLGFYDLTMVAAGLLSAATWAYASAGDRLIDPGLPANLRRRSLVGPLKIAAVFGVSFICTLFVPQLDRWVWLLLIPAALL
jgi:uncharacterized membrane protein